MKHIHMLVCAALLAPAALAFAHGDAHKTPKADAPVVKEQKDWGIAGDARAVARTVDVHGDDSMRYTPDRIAVKRGETVRIRVHNDGRAQHEVVLGTRTELEEHAALMRKFPNMEHDEPYMAHVPPGEMRQMIWKFNRRGEFDFACLMPGHFEAGMRGSIVVQ